MDQKLWTALAAIMVLVNGVSGTGFLNSETSTPKKPKADTEGDETMNGWIPVWERLPEKSGTYFVSGSGQVWLCELMTFGDSKGWCNSANRPMIEAWQEWPEPYEV